MGERTVLHVDMNNFYASVECLHDPALRGRPVAVGGSAEERHGIILAKNNEAKAYGIQTGEAPVSYTHLPCLFDVVLEFNPQGPIVPGIGQTAIDFGAGEDEAPVLA